MTSNASISSKLWKVPRLLPTIPANICTLKFFNDNKSPKHRMQTQDLPSFYVRIKPIPLLIKPPATYASGPLILRAFIHARTRHVRQPFRLMADQSLEAVYDSMRVDSLPRVVFAVGKSVGSPLRGKLHGYLRGKVKRRARQAFRVALEEIRRRHDLWRCDLDIVFNLKKNAMTIPFPELVGEMKKFLLSVHPKIVIEGMNNVNVSQKFMSDVSRKPPHILKWLEWDLGLDVATPESLQLLQRELIHERNGQIDKIQWDRCTVQGRYHDMQVHDDGTMSPLNTTDMTRQMEGNEEFTRKNLRDIMSYDELRKMFPTFPRRALRLYPRSARYDPEEDSQQPPNSKSRPYERSRPSQPRSPASQSKLREYPRPDPERIERQQNYYLGTTQRLPQRRREPFEPYEPFHQRKIREINEAIQSSPFKSSTRPGFTIQDDTVPEEVDHLEDVLSEKDDDSSYNARSRELGAHKASMESVSVARQKQDHTDQTFDYLFGDVPPTPSPTPQPRPDQSLNFHPWNRRPTPERLPRRPRPWLTLKDGSRPTYPPEYTDRDDEPRLGAEEALEGLLRATERGRVEVVDEDDEDEVRRRDLEDEALWELKREIESRRK